MKRVAFSTLGCKVNHYDTDVMKASFAKRGYSCVDFSGRADVYVVNTCTVTSIAARKSRQMAAKARKSNSKAIVVVVGCLGQLESEKVMEMTGADIVTGNVEKSNIVELIEQYCDKRLIQSEDIFEQVEYYQSGISKQDARTRILIKIQDGCNNYCSYCAIPFARGRSRSRQPDQVLKEINIYAKAGAKEIVLTGIHLDSYGQDLKNVSLIDILEKIETVGGITRVRMGSLEPVSITEEFAKRASKLTKLCPHFHLSLQSGSDSVLKRMRRTYTSFEFKEAVEIVKKYFNQATLTTDVIVGFPGETEDEFIESLEFIKAMGFLKVNVFKFSPRKGTLAYGMGERVDGDVKRKRSEIMIADTDIIRNAILNDMLGTVQEVLVEKRHGSDEGWWEGHTRSYVKIAFLCPECVPNSSVNVKISEISDEIALGCLK